MYQWIGEKKQENNQRLKKKKKGHEAVILRLALKSAFALAGSFSMGRAHALKEESNPGPNNGDTSIKAGSSGDTCIKTGSSKDNIL